MHQLKFKSAISDPQVTSSNQRVQIHELRVQLYIIIMSGAIFRVNPYSIVCLNVQEPLARSRHHISIAYLAKWLSVHLRTKWL